MCKPGCKVRQEAEPKMPLTKWRMGKRELGTEAGDLISAVAQSDETTKKETQGWHLRWLMGYICWCDTGPWENRELCCRFSPWRLWQFCLSLVAKWKSVFGGVGLLAIFWLDGRGAPVLSPYRKGWETWPYVTNGLQRPPANLRHRQRNPC